MPDWSYQPVFRPLLFRLPAGLARDFALNFMGRLGRMPFGGQLIDLMGHMQPDERLQQVHGEIIFPSSVGLGIGIDVNAVALEALARFGFGFMEIGPVTLDEYAQAKPVERQLDSEAIFFPEGLPTLGASTFVQRVQVWRNPNLPLIIRLGHRPKQEATAATAEARLLIEQLGSSATCFSLNTIQHYLSGVWTLADWEQHLAAVMEAAPETPILLPFSARQPFDRLQPCLKSGQAAGVAGYIVDGALADQSGLSLGLAAHQPAHNLVWEIRHKVGPTPLIIASGGIHEPQQALDLVEAGANLVQIDSGLVYSGPGLPKRTNEALLYQRAASQPKPARFRLDDFSLEMAAKETWFWTMLLGIAMLIGGFMAGAIAMTRVILPYDESFVGMSVAELAAINDKLLPFLTHDRVTLAGAMIAIGWFYLLLSIFGIRLGHHWAKVAILYSAMAGFFSFFLFLGFSYFDPFHAFVTAIMFQFILMGLHANMSPLALQKQPDLRNNRAWRRSLWAQLLFLMQGTAITVAGFVISIVGITTVFVAEDLEFMQTTAEALWAANPRLVPLIAHDRATLGGMLISSGISIVLATLWGFRPGERWLWWGLCLSSTIAYVGTVAVHLTVGYTDYLHLSPVFAGQAMLFVALWLSYPFLCKSNS